MSGIKRGQLLTGAWFKEELRISFELHRELKSCLSLRQAERIVSSREVEIAKWGKTAFMQFLNNFPLNYSYKKLSSPLRIYLNVLKLEDLNAYEQQLRYACLLKLREYVGGEEKAEVGRLIEEQESRMLKQVKVVPYDTVHAMNFLFFQRESKNSTLFYHCLDTLKFTNPQLLSTIFPRIVSLLLKRLSLDEWNYIRRFKLLTDHVVYELKPDENFSKSGVLLLQHIIDLQLHLVGYPKVPQIVDGMLAQAAKLIEKDYLDSASVQMLLVAFDLLPISYNERVFNALYEKLLEKCGRETVHLNKLPFKRLTKQQITALFDKSLVEGSFFNILLFIGNHEAFSSALKGQKCMKVLEKQIMSNNQVTNLRNLSNFIVGSRLLLSNERKPQIVARIKQILIAYKIKGFNFSQLKTLSICNMLQLLCFQAEIGIDIKSYEPTINKQILYRINAEFDSLAMHQMIDEAIKIHYDSPHPIVVENISKIINTLGKLASKFHFKFFPEIIFYLAKSVHNTVYQSAIDSLFNLLQPEDAPYFAELYNRHTPKSMKLNIFIINTLWKKHPAFLTVAKLMHGANYYHFTSPRGQILFCLRNIFGEVEPLLRPSDFAQLQLPQITSLLRFAHHFFKYIPDYSRKLLQLSLPIALGADFNRLGLRSLMHFYQAATALQLVSNGQIQNTTQIAALLKKGCEIFPSSIILKIQEIEMKWVLGIPENEDRRNLLCSELLQNLAETNYSLKHADVMVNLLKLHSYQIFSLSEPMQKKLTELVIEALTKRELSIGDLLSYSSVSLTNGQTLKKEQSQPLSAILTKGLQISNRVNFEVCQRFIELGNIVGDTHIVNLALKRIMDSSIGLTQIKKLVHYLAVYSKLQSTNLCKKIAQEAYNYINLLVQDLSQILFTLHSLQKEVPESQGLLYRELFQKNESYLLSLISSDDAKKSDEKIIFSILKHLWVSIKTQQISRNTAHLFAYILKEQSFLLQAAKDRHNHGISSEASFLIHTALLARFSSEELASLSDKSKKSKQKPYLKHELKNESTNMLRDHLFVLKNSVKTLNEQSATKLSSQLEAQGLKQIKSLFLSNSSNDCFIINKEIKGVALHCWVNIKRKEYGVWVMTQKYFNEVGGSKGREIFTANSLKMITGLDILLVDPKIGVVLP